MYESSQWLGFEFHAACSKSWERNIANSIGNNGIIYSQRM